MSRDREYPTVMLIDIQPERDATIDVVMHWDIRQPPHVTKLRDLGTAFREIPEMARQRRPDYVILDCPHPLRDELAYNLRQRGVRNIVERGR